MVKTERDIIFREATMADSDLLLQWRNDLQTREASLNSDEVLQGEHQEWLSRVLEDTQRHLYIALHGEKEIGSMRADKTGETYELSWTVAPDSRGQGFGKIMVQTLISKLEGPFKATIKKDNSGSINIAKAAGMMLEEQHDDILIYYRK